jgi:putative acetyltransferase
MKIRVIAPEDIHQIAAVIRSVLIEHNAPKVGTAFADISLDDLYATYSSPKSRYFVVEINGNILGGAGIAPLENETKAICELQKMYFSSEIRGKGIGQKMMEICLDFAKEAGYEQCYIETLPNMKNAQKLYLKSGFEHINHPMGNTGHHACVVWMLKKL